MKDKVLSKWQNIFVYSAVAGGILLVYKILLLIFFGADNDDKTLLMFDFIFVFSLIVVTMIKGINRYRDEHLEGYISYRQSFGHGFFICAFATLIKDLPNWVYNSFISDAYKNNAIQQMYDMIYDAQGAEVADSITAIYQNTLFSPAGLFISMLFNAAFAGLIVGAIVAGFTKRERIF